MWRNLAIGAAGSIVALVVMAAAEGIWGWARAVFGPSPTVPPGAVVAFDGECPKNGWETYQLGAGRFLFGADKTRVLHDEGGEENHTLSIPEMPKHNHDGDGDLLLVKVTGDHTADGHDKILGDTEFSLRTGERAQAFSGDLGLIGSD